MHSGCLVAHALPYLNAAKEVVYGKLVVKLNLASDEKLLEPADHVAYFAGEIPCDYHGAQMTHLIAQSNAIELGGITVHHMLSRKRTSGKYRDYHELITTYVDLICTPAEAVDARAKAKSFPVIEAADDESVFHYADTASSRAEIDAVTKKLAVKKLAIVGGGGTGSYVLDLVAKTPVGEIHVFDGDKFSQHNAFRSPGSASKEELRKELQKVDYLHRKYSMMHRHIIPHDYFISEANVEELHDMDFVFICIDRVGPKKLLIEKLHEWGLPFVEVGMGVDLIAAKLTGIVRTVTSTPENKQSAIENIPLTDDNENNEYAKNIQIADLNALNASLAVIKWKTLCGFYADVTKEYCSMYKVSSNVIINTDVV